MAMPWLFRMSHPPLFIPWNEVNISRAKVLFWDVVQFQLGREDPVTFGFREDFADQIRHAAGPSWPKESIG